MNKPAKLPNSKAVIAYLAQEFPSCFSTEGEAHPLKIGIFEDLAERLADDEMVSKTRLRSALRQYTSSWRYLRAVQPGAKRVNLDGEPAGEVEQEHADHAREQLKESKERAKQRRQAAGGKGTRGRRETRSAKSAADKSAGATRGQTSERPGNKAKTGELKSAPERKRRQKADPKEASQAPAQLETLPVGELTPGLRVQMKLGTLPVAGSVVVIEKHEAQVQLDSGMTVKVPVTDLYRS